MPRVLVIAVAAALVLGVAVLEGVRSNRWGPTEDMRAAAAKLDGVPREFGDWSSTEMPLDAKVLRVAEATGNVSRSYANGKTRDRFEVLLLCGPSGPIGAHTPDVCYAGLGYACVGKPLARPLGAGGGSFWVARFEKPAGEDPLRVYWAWGTDGDWTASASPRTEFLSRTVLYKLYVVRRDGRRNTPEADVATDRFLEEFLPLVKTALR